MFKRSVLLTICLLFIFSFSQLIAQEVTEDEEALRQALLDIAVAFENGDYAAIRSHIADDYVVHSPFGDLDWPAVEGLFTALSNALTDYTVTRDPVLVEGNLTTTRTVVSGVFENEFAGPMGIFPPTGQPFTLEYINILQFNENGQVIEEWVQFDVLNFMSQLGAMGDPAQTSTEDEEARRQAVIDIDTNLTDGNYEVARSYVTDDFVLHSPFGDLDWSAAEGLFTALTGALTDFTITHDPLLAEGNLAATHTIISGVFENEFVGPMGVFPPTGQPFTLEYISIMRFDENGKAVEEWAQFDVLNFMTQLGAMGDAAQDSGQ
jgi:predicted ester cyclase